MKAKRSQIFCNTIYSFYNVLKWLNKNRPLCSCFDFLVVFFFQISDLLVLIRSQEKSVPVRKRREGEVWVDSKKGGRFGSSRKEEGGLGRVEKRKDAWAFGPGRKKEGGLDRVA